MSDYRWVQLSDGSFRGFPIGMSNEEILNQMPGIHGNTRTQILTNPTPDARPLSPQEQFNAGIDQPEMSRLEAFGHGAVDGFTFGFNDEIEALSAAALAAPGPKGLDRYRDDEGNWFTDTVGLARDGISRVLPGVVGAFDLIRGFTPEQDRVHQSTLADGRAVQERAEATHPYFAAGGQIIGSAIPSLLAGGVLAPAVTMRNAAIAGGVAGSLSGLGSGETTQERLRNMVINGTVDGVAGIGGHGVRLGVDHFGRRFFDRVPERIRSAAEEVADVGASEGLSRGPIDWLLADQDGGLTPHTPIPEGSAEEYQRHVPPPYTPIPEGWANEYQRRVPSQFSPSPPSSVPKPLPLLSPDLFQYEPYDPAQKPGDSRSARVPLSSSKHAHRAASPAQRSFHAGSGKGERAASPDVYQHTVQDQRELSHVPQRVTPRDASRYFSGLGGADYRAPSRRAPEPADLAAQYQMRALETAPPVVPPAIGPGLYGPAVPAPLTPAFSSRPTMPNPIVAPRTIHAPKLRSRAAPVPGAMGSSARYNPAMQQLGSLAQGGPNLDALSRMAAMGTMGGGGRSGGHVANSVSNLMDMRAGKPVFNTPSPVFQKQGGGSRANNSGHQTGGGGKPRSPSFSANHAAKQNNSGSILGSFFNTNRVNSGGVGGYYGNGSDGGFTWG